MENMTWGIRVETGKPVKGYVFFLKSIFYWSITKTRLTNHICMTEFSDDHHGFGMDGDGKNFKWEERNATKWMYLEI